MPVTPAEFRRALGSLASGVTVVTLRRADGNFDGITVTAFCSLSLEPPLVLVCIARRARLHDEFVRERSFAVNLLAAGQESLSRRFAARQTAPLADLEFVRSPLGLPLLSGTVAAIECRVVDLLPGGDHTIVVGAVEHAEYSPGSPDDPTGGAAPTSEGQPTAPTRPAASEVERQPLLYFRGQYAGLA